MCILFLYICSNPGPGSYKLILAANRDEYFARPTAIADFWGTEPDIVGGRDMEPGREGGTWLAISKSGKIGALLNILHGHNVSSIGKEGRGFLVNNYLLSESVDGVQYLKNIYQHSDAYMPFNLVTIDILKNKGPTVSYYCNQTDSIPKVLGTDGIYSFGNSPYEKPFRKVEDGKKKFTNIVNNWNNTEKTEKLISELVKMLKCDEKHFPDIQMKVQAPDLTDQYLCTLTSKFVHSSTYGSRTHTVILVDAQNNVDYHESTMEDPINPAKPKWLQSTFNFNLQPTSLQET